MNSYIRMSTRKRTIDAFFGAPKSTGVTDAKRVCASPSAARNAEDKLFKNEDLDDNVMVSNISKPGHTVLVPSFNGVVSSTVQVP